MTSIQARSPINGLVLGEFELTSAAEISEKLQLARQAASEWGLLEVKSRVKKLAALSQILLDEMDHITEQISLCSGKVRTEALLGEIYPILDLLAYYQKHAANILRLQPVITSFFGFPGASAHIEFRPYGVIAIISPWNYPFQLSVAPLITALLAGNAVLLKVSELSLPIAVLILELFAKLNLPDGLLQCVFGDGQTGQQLIDAEPDLVFFTGSLATGRSVMQRAAQHPIPVMLELGGKDPMLIFADAHLERACHAVLYGAFCNSGQVCVSIERLYIEECCFDQFLNQLLKAVDTLQLSRDPHADLGAICSEKQFEILQAQYEDAISQGAQASAQFERNGNYLKPIVLWNVHHGMRILREESFGPILPVMSFKDEAKALQLANDSEFGLNVSIWTQDLAKAKRVARQINTGNWVINDVIKNIGHPALPFGGVKHSGFGRYHGAAGLLSFSQSVSGMTNSSNLRKEPNWFPYSEQGYQNFKGYLDFVFGRGSWIERGKRNQPALNAFREYSTFNLSQSLANLKIMLTGKRG